MPFPLNDMARDMVAGNFRGRGFQWAEEYFVPFLSPDAHSFDVYCAVLGLRDCGTKSSVPHLVPLLHHPDQDVKCTSILTIAHLAGAEQTELFVRALQDPTYRDKAYAARAIEVAADGRAVGPLLAYSGQT